MYKAKPFKQNLRVIAVMLLVLAVVFALVPIEAFAAHDSTKGVSEAHPASSGTLKTGSSNLAVSSTPVNPSVTCNARFSSSIWRSTKSPKKLGAPSGNRFITAVGFKVEGDDGSGILYRAYKAKVGWSKYFKNGATCGGGKRSRAIQALRVKLTGPIAKTYTLYYRVSVKGYGWTGWGKNGEAVGACKLGNVHACQLRLVKKDADAPGSRKNRFFVAGASSAESFYAQGGKTRSQLIKSIRKARGSGLHVFGMRSYKRNSKAMKRLRSAIKSLKGYKLGFVMMDLTSGAGISYNPGKKLYGASVLKGPYVAAVNKYYPSGAKRAYGTMISVIEWSSNDGYSLLHSRFGSSPMLKMMSYSGVSTSEMNGYRMYDYVSARTLAKLWMGTYWYFYRQTNDRSANTRNLYAHPLNSFIDKALKHPTRTKGGWFSGKYNVQNDAGIVLANGHPYVVVVMSSACWQFEKLSNLVRAIDGVHTDMVKKGRESKQLK